MQNNYKPNTVLHNRQSIRLKNYDYSKTGAYFITICAYDRFNNSNLFGENVSVVGKCTQSFEFDKIPYFNPGRVLNTGLVTGFDSRRFGINLSDKEYLKMIQLNAYGKILYQTWIDLPKHNKNIFLDFFIIMPDHFHGIIKINNNSYLNMINKDSEPKQTEIISNYIKNKTDENKTNNDCLLPISQVSLFEIIRQFKSFTAKQINQIRQTKDCEVWQQNYFERIIRNDAELYGTRKYIINNPFQEDDGDDFKDFYNKND